MYFTPCSSASIVNFEHITASWDITKSRLDVQFLRKIPLDMVIGQQMKEEWYDKN